MLTTRGSGLLATAVALWLGSRVFGTPELQIAAVALVALVAVAVLRVWTGSTDLHADRFVQPAKLAFGARSSVQLTITNRGGRRTGRIHLRESAPAALADPPTTTLPGLRSGERVTISYPLEGRQRGVAQLGPAIVELSDPFRIASRTRTVPGTATVTVRPQIVPLGRGLPLGGMSGGSGEGRPRPRPGGEDIAEVREYVQGDPLRAVHWPSTAHRGKLMVRREEGPQDPRATVVLDLRAARHLGEGPDASLETAIRAAASVLSHLGERRQGVALVDRPGAEAIRARPVEAWLDHLAEVESTEDDLRSVIAPLTAGTPVGSTLIAVVTTPDAQDLPLLVRAGRSASTRVALLVDVPSHLDRQRQDPTTESAAGRLRAAGWRVAILRGGDDLVTRWNEVLHAARTPAGAR